MSDVVIRPATRADVPALGRLGAELMRVHHAFDADRFMDPGADPETGYARFLGAEIDDPASVIFIADHGGAVVGYVYAGLEPQSWKELREAAGFLHDLVVLDHERRAGVATRLVEAACDWLRARGAPRVLLWAAGGNRGAQALFTRLGFRTTMVEMTLEL